jgi:phosphoribosylamine--glycine ligase
MNILFISKDLAGADLCYSLKMEGHNARLFIEDKDQKNNLDGLVDKTEKWEDDLDWVTETGLIVFDTFGYGEIQDQLREKGYSVVGGNKFADMLEQDRQYGQKIFSVCGIGIVSTVNFCNVTEAIKFVQENDGPWVIKQNGHANKSFNYVGQLKNGKDVISVLENYNRYNKKDCVSIDLQKKVEGIEIGVARYFNGNDWVGPIELNIEHKGLCDNDLGPKTDEMGTLMWYDSNEENKLFNETLKKLKPYLKSINFKGDIDINCIVNEKTVFPLEATPRFGSPSTQLQRELHISPWGDFLKAIADGTSYDLKYRQGFGIIVLVATPPFPYDGAMKKYCPNGEKILFNKAMSHEEMKHIHFEEVSLDTKTNELYISSKKGYVLHVGGTGKNVAEARKRTYELIDNIIIPKKFYRTDIGLNYINRDEAKLREWGWI